MLVLAASTEGLAGQGSRSLPLNQAPCPWEGGSLVSRKHSSACTWMAPETLVCHEGPGGRWLDCHLLQGASFLPGARHQVRPLTYALSFVVIPR